MYNFYILQVVKEERIGEGGGGMKHATETKYGFQSLKYLLSVPLEKKLTELFWFNTFLLYR